MILIFVHLVAQPRLTGVLLQWSRLFEPYAQNIVQYRVVANLTLTLSNNDEFTPYTTLAMAFPNALSHEFTVPRSVLQDGVQYEFRLGFPFTSYTFYTNTLVAKTFDANSPFVNSVKIVPNDVIASISWKAPEYNDGIVGYHVGLFYQVLGNGGVKNLAVNTTSGLTQVLSVDLPLTQTSITVGCTDLSSSTCLVAYTTYLVQLSVIRQAGTDSPKSVSFATTPMVLDRHNTSSLFLHGGKLTVRLTVGVPTYVNAPIATTFLWPVTLRNARGDLQLTSLNESTVQTLSNKSVAILLSNKEYLALVNQMHSGLFSYSAITMYFGSEQRPLAVDTYCELLL